MQIILSLSSVTGLQKPSPIQLFVFKRCCIIWLQCLLVEAFSCSVFVLYIDSIYACITTIYRAQLTNIFKLLLKVTSLGFNCVFNISVSLMYVSCCMCLFRLVVGSCICGIFYDYKIHIQGERFSIQIQTLVSTLHMSLHSSDNQ